MSRKSKQKRAPGRPRAFDRDAALHAAMLVFWRHGYEASSLTLLTEAMEISRPTLYAVFGDKANLFRDAVAAYTTMRDPMYAVALALPTSREVAEALLQFSAHAASNPETPSGCLLVQGALAGSAESACLRDELAVIRQHGTALIAKRFRQARREGDLPREVDPDILAEYLSSLAYGITIQAASGSRPEQLARVVELALANWPARPGGL